MLDLLQERLTDARAFYRQVYGPAQLAQAISEFGGPVLVLEDHPWLREASSYFPKSSSQKLEFISNGGQLKPDRVETMVSIGLGAIPATGSVLLGGGAAQAFRLSLCPCRHIVVIPSDCAELTVAAALALTAAEPSGLVSWVTGPSRTADIEKVLVLGAQGASELVVIIYQRETL